MSREARRFKISGELEKIVVSVMEERKVFRQKGEDLAKKNGFKDAVMSRIFQGGFTFVAFSGPTTNAVLSNYSIPDKQKHYYPKRNTKAGKEIFAQIKDIPNWTLSAIWEYIEYENNPFAGKSDIYTEKKMNNEILFYTYDKNFKGHKDLQELKMSEYYKLIGE